jgi:3-dehydro-L-gulonate-6-phosphate decarboxylase
VHNCEFLLDFAVACSHTQNCKNLHDEPACALIGRKGDAMEIPKLQLALDTYDLPLALAPLQKAQAYLDVIEVGTILCLSEGMRAVRVIRSLFPEKTLLADVRIVEAGGLISKLAFDAGADWVTVVSGATLTTAEVVAKEAHKRGGEVQIELIDGWPMAAARQWLDLGIRQVITHRSRDGEVKGELTWEERDFDEIRRLADMGFRVTVTGGVKNEDFALFAGVPVYIFIVGRGIYKADDPQAAAKSTREMMTRTFAAEGKAAC